MVKFSFAKLFLPIKLMVLSSVFGTPAYSEVFDDAAYFGREDWTGMSREVTLQICRPSFSIHITQFDITGERKFSGSAYGHGTVSNGENGVMVLSIQGWSKSHGDNGGPRMAPQSIVFEVDEIGDSRIRLVDMGCMHNLPQEKRPECGYRLDYVFGASDCY